MRYIEQFTACRVLPDSEKGVADDDSPRRQLAQQLCHGLGSLTVSRDNYDPFQVLPKFAGDDAPLIERARGSRSDLNERPVSNQRKRDFAVRQWAVNNEMVVAMYQNPYHDKVTLPRYRCLRRPPRLAVPDALLLLVRHPRRSVDPPRQHRMADGFLWNLNGQRESSFS